MNELQIARLLFAMEELNTALKQSSITFSDERIASIEAAAAMVKYSVRQGRSVAYRLTHHQSKPGRYGRSY